MKVTYKVSKSPYNSAYMTSLRDGRDGVVEMYRNAAAILELPIWKRGLVYVFTGIVFETIKNVGENRWEITFNFPLLDLMPRLSAAVGGAIDEIIKKNP